jgi:hypothetical protein
MCKYQTPKFFGYSIYIKTYEGEFENMKLPFSGRKAGFAPYWSGNFSVTRIGLSL